MDTKNTSNEINSIGMLWTVPHLWLSRALFSPYFHWSSLVLQNGNGAASFISSMEGMTQGDPLAIFAYGIGILSLIKKLKAGFPDANQTWYSNDSSSVGIFSNVELYFNSLK